MFITDILKLSLVDGGNLILVGAGFSIGAGLVAMTGGGLIGSLLEGLGSLFGAKSPMEKVTDFAKGLEDVDMTKIVDLGNAFEKLQNAEGAIMLFSNVDAKAKGLKRFAEGIDELTAALIRLEQGAPKKQSWWDKMTALASKVMGTTPQQRTEEQIAQSEDRLVRKQTARDQVQVDPTGRNVYQIVQCHGKCGKPNKNFLQIEQKHSLNKKKCVKNFMLVKVKWKLQLQKCKQKKLDCLDYNNR